MEKLFTRCLSSLFVICFFSISSIVHAQQAQKTVQLLAEDVSKCYSASNEYLVKLSVRDFIQLVQFDLALNYEASVFDYKGYTLTDNTLQGVDVSQSSGSINLSWDNGTNPVTIGDGMVKDFITLKFSIKNFPFNVANSYVSALSWIKNDFSYYNSATGKISNYSTTVDGKLNVSVGFTDIQLATTNVNCPNADADVDVISPAEGTGFTYLFNEDPDPANWIWTSDAHSFVSPGSTYSVRVKDSNGCISLVKPFTVASVTPLTYSVSKTDAACNGSAGKIQISVAGGTGPYTYWVVPKADFNAVQTFLASPAGKFSPSLNKYKKTTFLLFRAVGDYYVAVDDVNLCKDLTNRGYWTLLSISQPQALSIVVSNVQDEHCNNAKDGSFNVTVAGGALPEYEVSIVGQKATTVNGFYTFTGLAPGNYTVNAKDVNGCSISSRTVTIGAKAAITFAIDVKNATCGGLNDGSINVMNIANGTPPYKLTIVTGGNPTIKEGVTGSYQFKDLSPDYYSLTVTDAKGCSADYNNPDNSGNSIALQSPLDIKFTLNILNPSCVDGNATVEVTGVAGGAGAGYLYSLSGGDWQASNQFVINQPFDPSYTISAKNASGPDCSVTLPPFSIVVPGKLTASLPTLTMPSCSEGSNGKIEIDVSGGTTPYSYALNEGAWVDVSGTLVTIDNLTVGNYKVNLKDAHGCMISAILDANLSQDKNIITASADKIDCFNEQSILNATTTIWADNGVGRTIQYKYAFSVEELATPSGIAFTPGVTTLAPGKYFIGAIDQFDCMSNVVEVDIDQNPELIITSVVPNAATCYGSTTGTITIQATGGTVNGFLQYALSTDDNYSNIDAGDWKDFATYDPASKLSTVSIEVAKGVYFISVRDNHCINNLKHYGPVTIKSYDLLTVNEGLITKSDVLCWNNPTGSITLPMNAVSGGAGAYLFTLKDATGNDIAGKVGQPTGTFDNLKAGTYSILVNDTHDCSPYQTAIINITEPNELLFTATPQDATGFGIVDGKIIFSAVGGGNGIYTAVISGNAVDGTPKTYTQSISAANDWTVSNLAASEDAGYNVSIKDGNNCESMVIKVVVKQPAKLVVTLTKGVDAFTCADMVDGTIEANATGGVEVYSYSFYQDGILVSDNVAQSSFQAHVGHTYKVVVTDKNGYTANAELVINTVMPIVVNINDITCFGATNPTATIDVSGDPGRSFRLQYAAVIEGAEQPLSIAVPITGRYTFTADSPYGADGTIVYNFYVDDAICATKEKVTKTFVKIASPLDASVDQPVNEVYANITLTGGTAPYTYEFGSSQGSANSAVPFVVNGIKTTATNLIVTDAHGCQLTKPIIANLISVMANPDHGDNQPSQFDVVLTFNRSVTVAVGDITGGTYTPGTGTSFTVSMTGAAFAELSLKLGTGITDASGNKFEGKTFTYKIGDFTAPTLVVTPPVPPIAKTFIVGLKFSKPVNGVSLDSPNIQVTNGKLLSVTGNSDVYTLTVSAEEQTDVSIVLSNGIVDTSVNANKFAGVTLKYKTGDFTKPTLVVTPPESPIAKTFIVGLKFSEPVTGVSLNSPNIQVFGGTLVSVTGSDDSYTLTVSALEQTEVTIVLSNEIVDTSANKFAGVTLKYTTSDFTSPTLIVTPPVSPIGKTFTVGLKFSEPVKGVSLISPAVKVTGGTLISVIGNKDVYTLTISGNDLATVNIVLSNAITDKSVNANKFSGATLNYTIVDNTDPLLVNMTPNMNTVLTDTRPRFKMTFNENVKMGVGGNLVVYKIGSSTPLLTVPITANMIVGKNVYANYTGVSGLERNTRYYVLVEGSTLTDIAGNKFAGVKNSDTWIFKTGDNWPTSIDTNPSVPEFKVYPNPFNDVVYLVSSSPLSKVVVTNIVGQVVKEVVNPTNSIELNELSSGIYFISLFDMDNVIAKTAKIVKR